MPVPSEVFEDYLAPGESLVDGTRGRVVDGGQRAVGAVGVTDRRVLFVGDADRFVEVAHDHVCSIRSDTRTTLTRAGLAYPLVALGAGIVGGLSFLGLVALAPGAFSLLFAALSVGGVVAAEAVRRTNVGVDLDAVAALRRTLSRGGEGSIRDLRDVRLLHRDADNDAFVLGIGLLSLFGLVGLIAATGQLLAVPVALVSIGGIALAEHAYRRTQRLDAGGTSTRRERDVHLHLVDGRTVDLRVDAGDRIDRRLSGALRGTAGGVDAGAASPTGGDIAGAAGRP